MGLDVDWTELRREGARFGIDDCVPLMHLVPPGCFYATDGPGEHFRSAAEARGYSGRAEFQKTIATWRPWSAAPPWI